MKVSWKQVILGIGSSLLSANLSLASDDAPYYIDEDSVRTFGNGCDSADELFIDFSGGGINIIFTNLHATATSSVEYSNCTVFFDVYADDGYKLAAPEVTMSVNYSIDKHDGNKGVASAKLTTLGESRTAGVKALRGVGSKLISSPKAKSPKYSQCGGKMTFRVTGRLTAIADSGIATLTMDDATSDGAYSIKCHVDPKPC